MAREIHIRPTRTTRICSIRGCGGRDTVLVARSADLRGGVRLCRDCARAVWAWFEARDAEPVTEPEVLVDPAPAEEVVEKVEPTPEEKAAKPKGKKKSDGK